MKTLQLVQGSDEWNAIRGKHPTASEASVMMGASSKASRRELLKIKALGDTREVSDWVQKNLFDNGHIIEAKARPIAEGLVGEELYPATALDDDGYLLASFDGITMLEDSCWECKSWNEAKAESVRRGQVPREDYWQVVQQLVVSRARRCLYMVTDGTEEQTVYTWMELDPEDEAKLLAGWKQFQEDLANYQHVEDPAPAVGVAPAALPALVLEITGGVKSSNLIQFRDAVLSRIKSINTDLQTDNDFADAEQMVKSLKTTEEQIELVKRQALAKTADIDRLFKTVDDLKEVMRSTRLELGNRVKARKEAIRAEIRQQATDALNAHILTINTRLERVQLPEIRADFAGAMKGKRTVSSLRDAVDAELARAKIEASELGDKIGTNLQTIDALGKRHSFLFGDVLRLVLKDPGDLAEIVKARVIQHEAEEAKRKEEERERIRQEEAEKLRQAQLSEHQDEVVAPAPAEYQCDFTQPNQSAGTGASAGQQSTAQLSTHSPTKGKAQTTGTPGRPSDQQIISALSMHFKVPARTVIAWLSEMDLDQASMALSA